MSLAKLHPQNLITEVEALLDHYIVSVVVDLNIRRVMAFASLT